MRWRTPLYDSVLEPDPIQRRVFSWASMPDDSTSWVSVWFAVTGVDNGLEVSCVGQPQEQAFQLERASAATCVLGGNILTATWTVDNVGIYMFSRRFERQS